MTSLLFKDNITIELRDPGFQGPKGLPGQKGDPGDMGPQGLPGQGVATGGTTGQILKKNSDTDYDTAWEDAPTGGGGGGGTGDMLKATYDTNNDGVVDNSEALEGHNGAYYLNTDHHTDGTTNKVYTDIEKTKLAGIEEGAEVNVNSDWNAASGDARILNKPSIPEAQIQSDWNQTNNSELDFIKNKPSVVSQIQSDWTQSNSSSLDYIQHKPHFAAVATSGSYTDLISTPFIPYALSDLTDDAMHRTVTDTNKSTWTGKQDALVSGTNIKTINSTSLLGSGNIAISGGVTSVATGTGLTGGPITGSGTIALANMSAQSLKGNSSGSSAAPADLTATQVVALLPDMVGSGSSHARGLPPDPGASAGITKYLREDASWGVPLGNGLTNTWNFFVSSAQSPIDIPLSSRPFHLLTFNNLAQSAGASQLNAIFRRKSDSTWLTGHIYSYSLIQLGAATGYNNRKISNDSAININNSSGYFNYTDGFLIVCNNNSASANIPTSFFGYCNTIDGSGGNGYHISMNGNMTDAAEHDMIRLSWSTSVNFQVNGMLSLFE